MYKGIFWCNVLVFDDDMFSHKLYTQMVKCDANGNALEEADFSSKSGDNFNHQIEWEKMTETEKFCRQHPYNYFPRGRVEVNDGNVRIFANPVILDDEDAKALIIKSFELESLQDSITWIADNSKHYRYVMDAMGDMPWLDDDTFT